MHHMVTWFMPILTKQNSKAIDLLTNQASRMTDTRQRLWMHCTWTHAEVITRISLISVNEEQLSFEKGFNHLSNAMISYSIFSNVFNFSEHCHWAAPPSNRSAPFETSTVERPWAQSSTHQDDDKLRKKTMWHHVWHHFWQTRDQNI